MKKKYSVYRSKAIYGCPDINGKGLVRLFYVFVNDELTVYERSLIHPVECRDKKRYIGVGVVPDPWFMKSIEYCGEVDSIYEIDFDV